MYIKKLPLQALNKYFIDMIGYLNLKSTHSHREMHTEIHFMTILNHLRLSKKCFVVVIINIICTTLM